DRACPLERKVKPYLAGVLSTMYFARSYSSSKVIISGASRLRRKSSKEEYFSSLMPWATRNSDSEPTTRKDRGWYMKSVSPVGAPEASFSSIFERIFVNDVWTER